MDIISSSKLTVFLELRSRVLPENCSLLGTYSVRGQISKLFIWPVRPARAFILKLLRKSPYEALRAVRISASRAEKSRTALLGTRTASSNTILEDFVASYYVSLFYNQKANTNNISDQFYVQISRFFVTTSSFTCS